MGSGSMSNSKIRHGDWVIVCDGRKALILQNIGDAKFPNLSVKETLEHRSARTHEQGTAPPGRSHQSVGPARSAVAQTDWHDEAERAFLKSLADRLDAAVTTGEAKHLTMVASPRALGMIRQAYSSALSRAIIREVGKDLVKAPIDEIEKQILAE